MNVVIALLAALGTFVLCGVVPSLFGMELPGIVISFVAVSVYFYVEESWK